jgi:hypothetical protein
MSADTRVRGNKKSSCKNHTILIDDRRLLGTDEFMFITEDQIREKLLEINPDYEITYEDGYQANDIIVARIKNENN